MGSQSQKKFLDDVMPSILTPLSGTNQLSTQCLLNSVFITPVEPCFSIHSPCNITYYIVFLPPSLLSVSFLLPPSLFTFSIFSFVSFSFLFSHHLSSPLLSSLFSIPFFLPPSFHPSLFLLSIFPSFVLLFI